jgi:hypothetical protein
MIMPLSEPVDDGDDGRHADAEAAGARVRMARNATTGMIGVIIPVVA